MEIDYGLALNFIDDGGDQRPYQLRFHPDAPLFGDLNTADGPGQLIAVIASGGRPDNGHRLAISKPGVSFRAVEQALDDWQTWARIDDHTVSLERIQNRIRAAGLSA